jgi:hypothetical protein
MAMKVVAHRIEVLVRPGTKLSRRAAKKRDAGDSADSATYSFHSHLTVAAKVCSPRSCVPGLIGNLVCRRVSRNRRFRLRDAGRISCAIIAIGLFAELAGAMDLKIYCTDNRNRIPARKIRQTAGGMAEADGQAASAARGAGGFNGGVGGKTRMWCRRRFRWRWL